MTGQHLSPAMLAWARRARPGASATGCVMRPLSGGSVAHPAEWLDVA